MKKEKNLYSKPHIHLSPSNFERNLIFPNTKNKSHRQNKIFSLKHINTIKKYIFWHVKEHEKTANSTFLGLNFFPSKHQLQALTKTANKNPPFTTIAKPWVRPIKAFNGRKRKKVTFQNLLYLYKTPKQTTFASASLASGFGSNG
ncbi:hypothetical protein V6Z12_A02G036000 [Gossypium hirsutum]